jgi:rhodanese-related sulfurtransferase
VASALDRLGFESVWNLVGGVERWSREVDPSFPRY